jgi:hypothetical protein
MACDKDPLGFRPGIKGDLPPGGRYQRRPGHSGALRMFTSVTWMLLTPTTSRFKLELRLQNGLIWNQVARGRSLDSGQDFRFTLRTVANKAQCASGRGDTPDCAGLGAC